MDPMTIMALTQAGVGLSQMVGGLLTKVPDRPQYQPNQATQEMVNTSRTEANSSLVPGQAQMQDSIRATTANAVNNVQRNSTNSADILAAASAAQMGENRSMGQLYQQSLSYKDRARARHMQALSSMSQAQDQAWQINKQQPYTDAVATKSALFGAGMQTTMDAAGGLGAILQSKPTSYQQQSSTSGVGQNSGFGSGLGLPTGNGSEYSNYV